mmetsp:Transcript_35019/g.46075  ORF Transcript_35019/g.46075 Transcript_35019/m.46075 type:complete len:82 (-) Transcript_35019:135-380(-)
MAKRYSDLQLKVLTFYREYLKLAMSKPEPLRGKMSSDARALMEKHRHIKRTNFTYIEFVLRMESNKLMMLKEANVSNISRI